MEGVSKHVASLLAQCLMCCNFCWSSQDTTCHVYNHLVPDMKYCFLLFLGVYTLLQEAINFFKRAFNSLCEYVQDGCPVHSSVPCCEATADGRCTRFLRPSNVPSLLLALSVITCIPSANRFEHSNDSRPAFDYCCWYNCLVNSPHVPGPEEAAPIYCLPS